MWVWVLIVPQYLAPAAAAAAILSFWISRSDKPKFPNSSQILRALLLKLWRDGLALIFLPGFLVAALISSLKHPYHYILLDWKKDLPAYCRTAGAAQPHIIPLTWESWLKAGSIKPTWNQHHYKILPSSSCISPLSTGVPSHPQHEYHLQVICAFPLQLHPIQSLRWHYCWWALMCKAPSQWVVVNQ